MPDRMPNRMSEDMSDRMPEDVPVRTCINVMVGITRSKVIFSPLLTRVITHSLGEAIENSCETPTVYPMFAGVCLPAPASPKTHEISAEDLG